MNEAKDTRPRWPEDWQNLLEKVKLNTDNSNKLTRIFNEWKKQHSEHITKT